MWGLEEEWGQGQLWGPGTSESGVRGLLEMAQPPSEAGRVVEPSTFRCLCEKTHKRVHKCICIHTHLYEYIRKYICVGTQIHSQYVFIYEYMRICVEMNIYIRIYTRMHIYIRKYIRMKTYTRMYKHTRFLKPRNPLALSITLWEHLLSPDVLHAEHSYARASPVIL